MSRRNCRILALALVAVLLAALIWLMVSLISELRSSAAPGVPVFFSPGAARVHTFLLVIRAALLPR